MPPRSGLYSTPTCAGGTMKTEKARSPPANPPTRASQTGSKGGLRRSTRLPSPYPAAPSSMTSSVAMAYLPSPCVYHGGEGRYYGGSAALGLHFRRASDARVGEEVTLVAAGAGELGDDGPLRPGLEPVAGIRADGVLLSGLQLDLVEDGVVRLAARGRNGAAAPGGLALHAQPHHPLATAEGLHLPRLAGDGRMAMLGAGLPRQQHQLLRAVAIGVDVDHEFEPGVPEIAEPEVGHLEVRSLLRRQHQAGRLQHGRGPRLRLLELLSGQHATRLLARPCATRPGFPPIPTPPAGGRGAGAASRRRCGLAPVPNSARR